VNSTNMMHENINKSADGSLCADGSLLADGSLCADGSLLADGSIDVCGLSCPLPLLKAKQALNKLGIGQILSVVCTDSGSVRDFKVFCEQSGNKLLESNESEGKYHYRLQKA
jgi:tRNA 2-thiouridine synthesizing protein A